MDRNNNKYHDKYCDIKYWYDNEINKYSLPTAVLANKISEITSLINSYFDNSIPYQNDTYDNHDYYSNNSNTHLLHNNNDNYMNESNHSTRKSMVERQNELVLLQPKMYYLYFVLILIE